MMSSIDLDRRMLADRVRNDAFALALKKAIVPGVSTVTDIGAGTGFLGFLAEKLGAVRVYLYEFADVAITAKKLLKRNKLKRCAFIGRHTLDVRHPVRTDVVVTETLGNIATEENIVENLREAKRFVKPGGTIIPGSIDQYVAPVIHPRLYEEVTAWDRVGFGLKFDEARELSLNNVYVRKIVWKEIMEAQIWDRIVPSPDGGGLDPTDPLPHAPSRREGDTLKSVREGAVEWQMQKAVTIFGFCSFWIATLVPGITLSTSPSAKSTHWDQVYLPVREPLELRKDDILRLRLRSDTRPIVRFNFLWEVTVLRKAKLISKDLLELKKGQNS